ncbi:MAG: glutamate--tRNA ligase [Nitrososphaerales archaeon]
MQNKDDEISKLARKISFLNAIEHGGKADIGSVLGRMLSENPEMRKTPQQAKKFALIQIADVNLLDIDAQKRTFQEEFPGELDRHVEKKKQQSKTDSEKELTLPDLPDAVVGGVVTRFPPEPNGFMHIGHAKAAIIGYEYSKKYNGKFLIRFDDTNPSAEKIEYYDAFSESLQWLKITADHVKNASDDVPIFYKLAEKLIETSKAYACTCAQEEMRKNRSLGIACPHRSHTREQNLIYWREMLTGTKGKGSTTIRLLGDMQSLNTTMRDPVLFRIVEDPHPLKGRQYSVWPTYDFDGAVEDSLDGVTHALRSKEYELRDESYYAILDALALRKPRIIEFSRLELQNTTVSKRNLRKLIESGQVAGWDDPRLPTIAGLRRRGFLPEAIREFVLSMGLSKVESQPTWDFLESINRKLVDRIARRFFFVENPVEVEVQGAPPTKVLLKYHPEQDFGQREISTNGKFLISDEDAKALAVGMKIRLIEAYNIEVTSLGNSIRAKYVEKETVDRIRKVQWVIPETCLPLSVMIPGPLLIDENYNPQSLRLAKGMIESSASGIRVGEIFQLVRFGFCRLDSLQVAILTHK